MEIIVYQKKYETANAIKHFMDMFYGKEMTYLASNLLNKDFDLEDINGAIKKAIVATETLHLEVSQHFRSLYTHREGQLVKDCKLSKLGFALVVLNANPKNKYVANLQLALAEILFENNFATPIKV
ncbi:hypothetical protein [Algibacter sp. 2305UL17-15]|uniref:hypothetical protein n=1 Tax=Algibacter sp. 2305UL17-15 TaxID=3231268 RepID=UPI00345AE3E6